MCIYVCTKDSLYRGFAKPLKATRELYETVHQILREKRIEMCAHVYKVHQGFLKPFQYRGFVHTFALFGLFSTDT